MSSIDVAQEATSARPRVAVVGREMLWTGGIVEMKVPADATEGVYNGDGEEIHYLTFDCGVKGGVVKCFVHTDDPSCCGRKIKAEIMVMSKTLADERTYLYVDLRPVMDTVLLTHRLAIMPNEPGMWANYELRFETPHPLRGAIILAAPDAKIVPKTGKTAIVIEQQKQPKVAATGDSQLDRLLDDGWQIDRDDGAAVLLSKEKNDGRRTMTHHRRIAGNSKRK